jgi:peptidoglycan L-alanyl-D-glutamate endopeptidase CwlK
MSDRLFKTDILFLQRILAVSGFYEGSLNGKWSSDVDDAQEKFLNRCKEIKDKEGEFDSRTESCIMTLIPAAQIKAREFMNAVQGQPLTYRIISGTRTYAEQDALYAKRPKVTNARGGQSNHNFGIAWDVGIFDNGKYYEGKTKKEDKAYADLGTFIKANVAGLEWGGDWKSFVDMPHYQLATGKSVAQVRSLLEKGKSYA